MSREKRFYEFARKYVRFHVRKREVMKLEFDDAEMQEIIELQNFLKRLLLDNSDEMIVNFEGQKYRYIDVVFKVTSILNSSLSIMVDTFFKIEDFEYSKDPYYIGKAIYHLARHRGIEVFFCTSQLKVVKTSYLGPRRIGEASALSSVIFCDLDLPDELSSLDNEALIKLFLYEHSELNRYLGLNIVRSGGGLHVYVRIQSINIDDQEMYLRWRCLMQDLAYILKDWGADIKCIDRVRLLRVPFCINRKEKYGPCGRTVKLLQTSEKINDIDETEQVLDYVKKGGDATLFDEAAFDTFCNEPIDANLVEDVEFEVIEWNDDIFVGEIKPYIPPEYIVSEYRRLELDIEVKKESIPIINSDEGRSLEEITIDESRDYYNSLKDELVSYESIPKGETYAVSDILYALSNRETHTGIRHTCIYLCCYYWYHFDNYKDMEKIANKVKMLNTYFNPPLDDIDLNKQITSNFDLLVRKGYRYKNIRNEVLDMYFRFSDEEKWNCRGNYFAPNTPEYIEKERRRKASGTKNYYRRKKTTEGIKVMDKKEHLSNLEQRRKEAKKILLENPQMPYKEALDKGITKGDYDLLIYGVRKQVGIDTNIAYMELFEENPSITLEEFVAKTSVHPDTYYHCRKRYLYKDL